jgi:iron(III) transport system permease protein
VLAISEFGVPGLLRVRVFTTEVFTAFAALYDVDRAVLLTLPLLLVSTTVAAVAVAMVGERLVTTRRGASVGEVPLFQALKPVVVVAAVTMILLALVLPVVQLLREVLAGQPAAGVLPLQGRRAVFTALGWDGSGAAIRNSLVWSGIGATLTVTIGGLLGYSRARAGRRVGFLTDLLFVVLFAVPSTVVGVALIGFWNRSGPFGVVYGTSAMVWLASVARFLPVAALGMAAAVRHVPISHEEAAAAAGAGWTRTMVYVVVPQLVAAIAAVWVVVFVLAFGELGASLLVAPPGESTLPIRIYTLIANAPPAQVASLALLQTIVILSPLALLAGVMAARTAR